MTATLANLIANDNGLRVFCNACQRCAELDVHALVGRYGEAMELPEIGRRSRCKACGAKGGNVKVVAVRSRRNKICWAGRLPAVKISLGDE